jgi:hypothetical protein
MSEGAAMDFIELAERVQRAGRTGVDEVLLASDWKVKVSGLKSDPEQIVVAV